MLNLEKLMYQILELGMSDSRTSLFHLALCNRLNFGAFLIKKKDVCKITLQTTET